MQHFEYGGYQVKDMSPEAFPRLGPQAISAEQIVGEYDGTPLPPVRADLHPARDRYLAELKARADSTGATFDNNLSYSLSRIDVQRPQGGEGLQRTTVYRLRFRPTDYFHFQFPNNALDVPIEVSGRPTTAREALNLLPNRLSYERLDSACHYKMGTGTVVITKPAPGENTERVVVSIRSARQLMVGRAQGASYHLSAAEGMLRPDDGADGHPSPFRTSLRSLKEELGLEPEADFRTTDLRCLGFYLDTKRAQPFVLFFVRCALTFPEVENRWRFKADHRHENERLLGLPWTERDAHALAVGRIEDEDGDSYSVASNHAQLGFLMAAAHENELRRAGGTGSFLFR